MLGTIYTKSLRDRWVGTTVGMTIVGAFLVLAMLAYQEIGTELYTQMPEALRSLMGIPVGADAAALAYAVVFGMVGAMTLAGLGLSMGASTIAGEERDGTLPALLGNPRSRRQVLGAKAAGAASLVLFGGVLAFIGGVLAPVVLGADIGEAHVAAISVHLVANALLWAALAAAVGAITGNRGLASGASGGLMVLSYLLVGLLPLAEATADLARVVPWYWFDGHDPLVNGLSAGYLALQLGTVAVLAGLAWWRVDARDLTRPTGTGLLTGLVDRVRSDERAAALLDRVGGTARVGSIWGKTAAEGQGLVVIVSLVMFSMMGLLMGPMYAALESTLAEVSGSLPTELLAFVGGGDMSTPEGWYQLETFGLMTPIAVILVASVVGARALAGEEQQRTMGLLLANPVPRRSIVLQKMVALVLHTAVVGLATFLGVVGGSVLGGLGMSTANIAATALQATLLGVLFGALALAVSAATGSVRTATLTTVGFAGTAYFANSLLSISERLATWRQLTPFEWYLGGDPLTQGIEWSSVGLFVLVTALLAGAAVVLFDRRDLRTS